MARHRGKVLTFALSAALALFAGRAQAEIITITVTVGGTVIDTTPFTTGTSSSAAVDVTVLNPLLVAAGSAFQFSSLGATSDFPGQTGDTGGALSLNGQFFIPAGTSSGDNTISLKVTESGFTAPTGPSGTLFNAVTSDSNQAIGATGASFATFNGTNTPLLLNTATTSPSAFAGVNSIGVAPVSTGYTLAVQGTAVVPLPGAGSLAVPTISFASAAIVHAAAVPEPGSIVMFMTGMPLPLVVVGLLRRHRRQAA